MDIFQNQLEEIAINRLRRFAILANKLSFDVCLGFSGGKDSQVVYDLCKRAGIRFKAYFNHAFESPVTLKFIREYYPSVIWRRDYHYGFIENIKIHGFLPTVQKAYCCDNYKHNPKYVDSCSIVGVRRQESRRRKSRTPISFKNKTTQRKINDFHGEYFLEGCQSVGTTSVIQLLPIVDWTEENVWDYIHIHKLPINPVYKDKERVGCIVCPKASFTSNYISLVRYPKLIDAFISARVKGGKNIDWVISSDEKDYSEDKPYYICRWLNHSFMPFTAKQLALYKEVREVYDKMSKT